MTLTAIIEEGESLLDSARDATERNTRDRRIRQGEAETFAVEHFPTLIAVAKAAVEMRGAMPLAPYSYEWAAAVTAFDFAVRGEGKEKEG